MHHVTYHTLKSCETRVIAYLQIHTGVQVDISPLILPNQHKVMKCPLVYLQVQATSLVSQLISFDS